MQRRGSSTKKVASISANSNVEARPIMLDRAVLASSPCFTSTRLLLVGHRQHYVGSMSCQRCTADYIWVLMKNDIGVVIRIDQMQRPRVAKRDKRRGERKWWSSLGKNRLEWISARMPIDRQYFRGVQVHWRNMTTRHLMPVESSHQPVLLFSLSSTYCHLRRSHPCLFVQHNEQLIS